MCPNILIISYINKCSLYIYINSNVISVIHIYYAINVKISIEVSTPF